MKQLFLFIIFTIVFKSLSAQPSDYILTIKNSQPYTKLTHSKIVTDTLWDDPYFTIPLGFNFSFLGKSFDSLYASGNGTLGADLLTDTTTGGIMFTWFADIFDAKNNGNGKKSTIGYQTDTIAGKKITKIEWNNVAFLDDLTTNDSANVQQWMYEDSSVIEYRFGESSVQSIADIYPNFKGPLFGFVTNFDMLNFTLDWFYYVSNTNPATVDSADINALTNGGNIGISSFPANGTVFRFSRGKKQPSTNVSEIVINSSISLYPNPATSVLNINSESENNIFSIFDINGKLCLTQKLKLGKNEIDISNLPNGSYLTMSKNQNETSFYKIVKH